MKDLQLIAGDASDRKFYRLGTPTENSICMQFPKWEGGYGGDPISWIGMQSAFSQMDIPVPKILKVDETNACIWTEDLGDTFLNTLLTEDILDIDNENCNKVIAYYKESLALLLRAQYPSKQIDNPGAVRFFDYEKLYYELNFFVSHFLNDFLKLNINEENIEHVPFFSDLKLLAKKLDQYDKVLCHRDYHVRNIMIKNNKIYWIDFQDARMGPHSYDVVSLIRDSYVKITWKTRNELFKYYLSKLNKVREEKKLTPISESDYHMEVLLMGLQRNIKAIGSFGYLATKKNKCSYLKHVIPTLEILLSPESQMHEESNLKLIFPEIFKLLESLLQGQLRSHLNNLISSNIAAAKL